MTRTTKWFAVLGAPLVLSSGLLGATASGLKGSQVTIDATIKAPKCISMVDSNGKTVGTVIDVDTFTQGRILGFLQYGGALFPFRWEGARLNGVNEYSGEILYWASADCSGTPYILVNPTFDPPSSTDIYELPYRRTSVGGPLNSFYAQVEGSAAVFLTLHSFTQLGSPDCTAVEQPGVFVPTTRIFDIDSEFTGPYHVANAPCQ
jgi:hypothetical protein